MSEEFKAGDRVRVDAGLAPYENMTGEVEFVKVGGLPYDHAVMLDALGERRWFARGELKKEAEDVLE